MTTEADLLNQYAHGGNRAVSDPLAAAIADDMTDDKLRLYACKIMRTKLDLIQSISCLAGQAGNASCYDIEALYAAILAEMTSRGLLPSADPFHGTPWAPIV